MNPEVDPYTILGVARDCNADELKSAYRRLARENHPDIARDKSAATLRMTQINAAWSLIGDPQRRASFDARWRLDERDRQIAAQRVARQQSASRPHPHPHPAPKPAAHKAKTGRTNSPHPPAASRPGATKAAQAHPTPSKTKSAPKRPATTSAGRHARLAEASRLLFKQDKPNEALELCKSILKTDFRNIPARELMGEAYLRLGQTDRALAVWEQALVLAPGNITLRRRWLSLMPPETRTVYERKGAHVAQAVPRATSVSRPASSSKTQVSPGLFSRLVSKLKKR